MIFVRIAVIISILTPLRECMFHCCLETWRNAFQYSLPCGSVCMRSETQNSKSHFNTHSLAGVYDISQSSSQQPPNFNTHSLAGVYVKAGLTEHLLISILTPLRECMIKTRGVVSLLISILTPLRECMSKH